MAKTSRRHRFSVEDYHRMGEAGILTADDRVELLDGEVVLMGPIGRPHQICVNRLTYFFSRLGDPATAIVQAQGPFRIDEWGEPQPDLCVFRYREDFYSSTVESPDDLLLLVEVSDTSLAYDRGVKLPRYAGAGIRESWIVDLGAEAVEAFTRPGSEGYAETRRFRRGEALAPEALPDFRIRVDEVLPHTETRQFVRKSESSRPLPRNSDSRR